MTIQNTHAMLQSSPRAAHLPPLPAHGQNVSTIPYHTIPYHTIPYHTIIEPVSKALSFLRSAARDFADVLGVEIVNVAVKMRNVQITYGMIVSNVIDNDDDDNGAVII